MNNIKQYQSISYGAISEFDSLTAIVHAFGTKNCGVNKKERKASPAFMRTLHSGTEEIMSPHQIHSDNTCIVEKGTSIDDIKHCKADAIITNRKNTPLGVITADCIPVLLYDKTVEVIAAVHAGRVGTCKEIVKKTIQKMMTVYGSAPKNIYAAIGPGIGKCCYHISGPVVTATKEFLTCWPEVLDKHKGNYTLDLPRANAIQLKTIGVPDEQVFFINLCTSCNTDLFFSYRKEGEEDWRMMNVIMLR